MSKFLDDFLLTMPETQRQKLLELLELKKQNGIIKSDKEYQQELERLLKELDKRQGEPTFVPKYQKDRTNSDDYNSNMEAIAFDLQTIFKASNTIEQLLKDNQQMTRSMLENIRKGIYSLNAQVEKFKLLIQNADDYTDAVYEQFRLPEYTETDETKLQILRRDRFGEARSEIYNAENNGDSLQLAGYETIDQLKTSYGRKLSQIRVLHRTGLMASNNPYTIDKAIDGSNETFWAENVIVDDVITQNDAQTWSAAYGDYPTSGALCEIEILLNGTCTVSEVHFNPFTNYPLEIVSIYGYESPENNSKMHELISPYHENPYQRSQKSVDTMIFQFPAVDIQKLRILIRQENYVKENFIVDANEMNNQQLWDQMASSTDLIQDAKNPDETIAEFDRKNEITGWNTYLQKLKEWASNIQNSSLVEAAKKAMEVIRTGDYKNPMLLALQVITPTSSTVVQDDRSPELSKEWQATNKLSYLYGAYEISVFGRKYRPTSIYVSKPLPIPNNAKRLSLTTEERNHYITTGSNTSDQSTAYITDIEYYLTMKKNPGVEDWLPILPTNKKYVQGELLMGCDVHDEAPDLKNTDTINFSFRFPIVSKDTVVIRRNGYPMDPNMYIISDNGKQVGIKRPYYSASSIYTADYKPIDKAYYIDVLEDTNLQPTQYIDENGQTGEFFETVDQNNTITLKHLPYIHRDAIFQYDDESGQYQEDNSHYQSSDMYFPIIVRVDGEEFKNITDYATNSYDPERLKENDGKTFAQINNQIIFGHPIDNRELKNITVDYYYINTDIRLKAILRRNHNSYESLSPSLFSYHIKCQTSDFKA